MMPSPVAISNYNHVYQSKQDLMIQAARNGELEVIKTILHDDNGDGEIDVNGIGRDDCTALQCVCLKGHHAIAKLLLDHGATPDQQSLLSACFKGHELIVDLLMNQEGQGVHVNSINDEGVTPLHVACMSGQELVSKLLLQQGANVNATESDGSTPLHFCCYSLLESPCEQTQQGIFKCMRLLVHRGASNRKNKKGDTPLDMLKLWRERRRKSESCYSPIKLLEDNEKDPVIATVCTTHQTSRQDEMIETARDGYLEKFESLLDKNAGLLTDIGNTYQSVLAEVEHIGSTVSSLDDRLTLKVHALEQRCHRIPDRPHDTISIGSNEERTSSKKRPCSDELHLPHAKRTKLDDYENDGMTKLLEKCEGLQEKVSKNNKDFQDALEKMEKKNFHNNILLGLLTGIFWMKS